MKAVVINNFGSPEVLQIKDINLPIIKNNEVLIQVKASSINPVDWKHRKGNHKLIKGSKFPIVLGYDAAGIVEEIGSKVTKFKKGDIVYARLSRNYGGAYAEFTATSEDTVALMPESLSFEEAAAIPLAAVTALQGLRDKGNIKKGDNVLIIGAASGVGHFAVQIAKFYEAKVTAICSLRHENMMNDLKPDKLIDYTKTDILQLTEKFDIIFDVVGKHSFKTLHHLLKPGGTYITTLPRPKVLVHKILSLFTQAKKTKTFLMKSKGSDLEFLNELVEQNKFKVFIDKVFPMQEISKAHEYSETGKVAGKIVISVGN